MVASGTELYASLERETVDFQVEILWANTEQISAFEHRRQELAAAIQKIDTVLENTVAAADVLDNEDRALLAAFDEMRKSLVGRVRIVDTALCARAAELMQGLAGQMADLKAGNAALRGYAGEPGQGRLTMNRQA